MWKLREEKQRHLELSEICIRDTEEYDHACSQKQDTPRVDSINQINEQLRRQRRGEASTKKQSTNEETQDI